MMAPNNITIPTPRAFLDCLEAYVPGEQPREGGWVKLNTNEFPYPAAPEVVQAVAREAADSVRVYPDPVSTALCEALAARHGVAPNQVLAGNGSDEVLRLLAHAYLGPQRRLAVTEPTYTLYSVLAAMFETPTEIFPLDNAERLPEPLFIASWDACFLAVPNAQIGTLFPMADLRRLAARGDLLVLDGAYVDFAPGYDPVPLIEEFPNVVLTGTFSKSFGLAGMRVGYVIARHEIIDALNKLKDSYNINRVSQAAARAALAASAYYRTRCDEIIASRERLARELTARGLKVHESRGNFIFARRAGARELYEALKARRILVRYFNHSGLEDGVRITMGTPEEIDALLRAIDEINSK